MSVRRKPGPEPSLLPPRSFLNFDQRSPCVGLLKSPDLRSLPFALIDPFSILCLRGTSSIFRKLLLTLVTVRARFARLHPHQGSRLSVASHKTPLNTLGAVVSLLAPSEKPRLLDLPTELVELILSSVFTIPHPIELSPLTVDGDFITGRSTSLQTHPDATTYCTIIRPRLALLRTCKIFHALGIRIYYSKNRFRFSGRFGWYVLARFFHLIGSTNRALLRDVAIVHPSQSYTVRSFEFDFLIKDILQAFSMAALRNLDRVFFETRGKRIIQCQRFPLEHLRKMHDLRALTFVFYPIQDGESKQNQPVPRSQPEFVDYGGFYSLVKDGQFSLLTHGWQAHRSLKLKLKNFFADPRQSIMLKGAQSPQLWLDSQLIAEVNGVGKQPEAAGVEVEDMSFRAYAGS